MSEGCWICEYDPECGLCPDGPGQLGLFANEVLIEQDLADDPKCRKRSPPDRPEAPECAKALAAVQRLSA